MPIYNSEQTLRKSLDSILEQTYTNFELILVNDGSIDESRKICEEYKKKDKRIILINKKNEGSGIARNTGINIAKGKYVMFPDSDDWLEKTMIEDMLNEILINSVELVICKSKNHIINGNKDKFYINSNVDKKIFRNKEQFKLGYIEILKSGLAFGPSDKMYNLEIIKKNQLVFPDVKRSQDILFNIEYVKCISSAIILNKSLYNYRCGNIKDIYFKFPQDYFVTVLNIVNTWENMRKEWGGDEKKWDEFLGNYVARGINVCIINSYNPKYKLSSRERNQYIQQIISDNTVQKIFKKYSVNKLYKKVFAYCIKNKKYFLLKSLMHINMLI